MTGATILWLLIGGLGLAMAMLVVCRGHWYGLSDAMHRAEPDLLTRLDWPLEHPFNVPDPDKPNARPFPVRTTRARVLLFGLPAPDLCPPGARHHAARFRIWALAFLLGLAVAVVALISPWATLVLAGVLVVQYLITRPWPNPEVAQ